MNEFKKDVIIQAKRIAIGSFIIGSLIFLTFLFLSIKVLAFLGILFVLFALIANGITLLQLIYLWVWKKRRGVDIRNTILLVLANIPIALVYMKIGGALFRNRFGM